MAAASAAHAQLVVTEIMNDPSSSGDDVWEWIEVRNTGATEIDLNGYIGRRLGDASTMTASITAATAMNTIVPAGGVAVLYDADLPPGPGDFADQAFRDAWSLAANTPLVGVDNFPSLTNAAGTAVGFWPTAAALATDLVDDGEGGMEVGGFSAAAFSLDYRPASGFPASQNGFSLAWNGAGNYQDGFNWAPSAVDVGNAVTSVPSSVTGAVLNSVDDVGNPGVVPALGGSGVIVTEIMYDPQSSESDWEWIEIVNKTGAAINFGSTNYVFDDDDDAIKAAANITSGSVANGAAAVLFNASAITLQNMKDAWDPDGALGVNFIPVSSWTALANTGDMVAIWKGYASYSTEAVTGSDRTTDNAEIAVLFDDDGDIWPTNNGDASIHLTDLDAPLDGGSWQRSDDEDSFGSRHAEAAVGAGLTQIHAGGDVGSPGSAPGAVTPTSDADFDNNGRVDGRDLLIWQRGLGSGTTNGQGDADASGTVNGTDLAIWRSRFGGPPAVGAGQGVPEPTAAWIAGLVALALQGRFRVSSKPLGGPRGHRVSGR